MTYCRKINPPKGWIFSRSSSILKFHTTWKPSLGLLGSKLQPFTFFGKLKFLELKITQKTERGKRKLWQIKIKLGWMQNSWQIRIVLMNIQTLCWEVHRLHISYCYSSQVPVLNKYLRIFPSYCNSWVTSCTSQVYYHVTCIHAVFQTRVQFALAQVHVCPHCERRYLSSNILVSILQLPLACSCSMCTWANSLQANTWRRACGMQSGNLRCS